MSGPLPRSASRNDPTPNTPPSPLSAPFGWVPRLAAEPAGAFRPRQETAATPIPYPRHLLALAALLLLAAAPHARAQEMAEASASRSLALGLSADGAIKRGVEEGGTQSFNLYPTLDLVQPLPGGWRAELSLAPEAYASGAGGGFGGLAADDPYLFLSLTITAPTGLVLGVEADGTYAQDGDRLIDETGFVFVEAPRLGRLAYGVQGSAATEFCVEAPGGTTNFGADDLTTFGTCEGFAERDTLLYNTPVMARGHVLALSVTDSGSERLGDGAATRVIGAAIAYQGDWRGGALEWSVGVERALAFADAPPHGADAGTFLQGGVAWTQGAFTGSLSGGLQRFDGGRGHGKAGLALGLLWQATDRLLVAAGGTAGRIERARDEGDAVIRDAEATLGLAMEYAVIPDCLRLDAGVTVVKRDGEPSSNAVVGVGFAWSL